MMMKKKTKENPLTSIEETPKVAFTSTKRFIVIRQIIKNGKHNTVLTRHEPTIKIASTRHANHKGDGA